MKTRIQKNNIAKKVSEITDVPSYLIEGTPMISIINNETVHIENYGDIIEFREDMLRYRSKNGITVIKGSKFEFTSFTVNTLELKGVIKSIELQFEGEAK